MGLFSKRKFEVPPSGCIKSPLDKRDVLMSEIYPLPIRIASEMPPPFDLDILNQNGYPHCVGYAAAGIKQEKELRERKRIIFDGDWLYKKCKEIDGMPNIQGTCLRTVLKVLQKQGAKPLGQPESEAIKYRIGGYAQVDDLSLEGLKKAFYVSGVLLLGFRGSNQGWQTAYIRPPKEGESTWGHATFEIGYKADFNIGQNSWGQNWGDNGKFYIPQNYMPFEAWAVLTDLPTEFLMPNGLEGWVAEDYLRKIFVKGDIVFPYTRLNIREIPAGNKIRTLNKGEKLLILGETQQKNNYLWQKVKIL